MFHVVSAGQPTETKRLIAEVKAGIEAKLLAVHEKASSRLTDIFRQLKSEIVQKSLTIVSDVRLPHIKDKPPRHINPEDYKTLDELWSACILEDASKTGESHSDAKTIDLLETSDEGGVRPTAVSLISLIFEAWQTARQTLSTQIEKKAYKTGALSDEVSLTEEVNLLFWGKEVQLHNLRKSLS